MYTWLSDVGNPFLTASNSIGSDANGAQVLLTSHDQFEGNSHETYSLASQLFARAKELSSSGECNPDMIEEEAESLETAVSVFATRLDERREIILHAKDYHERMREVRATYRDGQDAEHIMKIQKVLSSHAEPPTLGQAGGNTLSHCLLQF